MGDGTHTSRDRPVQVAIPGGEFVTGISPGPRHAVAATASGHMYGWGANDNGQPGLPEVAIYPTPQQITIPWASLGLSEGTTVTAVSGGDLHSLALASTGDVVAFGDDSTGGGPTARLVQLPEGVKCAAVSAGMDHSLAITRTGDLLAWGGNGVGELGNPNYPQGSAVAIYVQLPNGVEIIAAATSWSLALTTDGRVLSWGFNDWHDLGIGAPGDRDVPTWVKLPAGVTASAIGVFTWANQGAVVTSTGRVRTWGENSQGALGTGEPTDVVTDTPVWVKQPPGVRVSKVSAGWYCGLAMGSTGPKLSWGSNRPGQLGNGVTTPETRHSPVYVRVDEDAIFDDIAGGFEHSLAINVAGQVLAWATPTNGRLRMTPAFRE